MMVKQWHVCTSIFLVIMALMIVGITLSGTTIHHRNNDYVKATCEITGCNQSSVIYGGSLCYQTILDFVLVGTSYTGRYTIIKADDVGCPDLNSVVTCYYRNDKTIAETLTLKSLANTRNNNVLINLTWIMGFILFGLVIITPMMSCCADPWYHQDIECGCCKTYSKM